MNITDLKSIIGPLNYLVQNMGCDIPEHQTKIKELQAAMQKVKDLVDGMEEC